MSSVNVQLELSFDEHRRLCLEFLEKRYAIEGYDWVDDRIAVRKDSQVTRISITDEMRNARKVYESLMKEHKHSFNVLKKHKEY